MLVSRRINVVTIAFEGQATLAEALCKEGRPLGQSFGGQGNLCAHSNLNEVISSYAFTLSPSWARHDNGVGCRQDCGDQLIDKGA